MVRSCNNSIWWQELYRGGPPAAGPLGVSMFVSSHFSISESERSLLFDVVRESSLLLLSVDYLHCMPVPTSLSTTYIYIEVA